MNGGTWIGFLVVLSALGHPGADVGKDEEAERLCAAQVFERAAHVYRQVPALMDQLTLVVRVPDCAPGTRILRYGLGAGTDAFVEIQGVGRIVTKGDHLYIERVDLRDRYVDVPFDGDFAATLARARGKDGVAGLWEPPQIALREGREIARVVDSMRQTRMLEELTIVGCTILPDSTYEIQLDASNGRCTVHFDAEFFLKQVDYVIQPPGAPAGYELRLSGEFNPQPLDSAEGLVRFVPGSRAAVTSLGDLEAPGPEITVPPADIVSQQALERRLLSLEELAEAVRGKRVLLIGESHRFQETVAYLTDLMERLDDRPISLLLELHDDTQYLIDRYLDEGDEEVLREIFQPGRNLPYDHILRWARVNRARLRCVLAMDESRPEIMSKRVFLADTRNQTMAETIADQYRNNPDVRVIAYGGQLHMGMSGRYRFDSPSREPAGSRLAQLGIERSDVASIMLCGNDRFRLSEVWRRPGALPIDDSLPRIPIAYLNDALIFGVNFADELFDYFVNLGPLTRIERE